MTVTTQWLARGNTVNASPVISGLAAHDVVPKANFIC
jgi:hypothetical protein